MAARTYKDTTNTTSTVADSDVLVIQRDDGFAGMMQTTVEAVRAPLVRKDGSKTLTTNDFTNTYKTAVDRSIELDNNNNLENAINEIKVNGTTVAPVSKSVNIDVNSAVEGKIVDNLTTEDATKALSAKQGKILNETKAATNGTYPDMQVGIANQLYSPDSDTSAAEYYVFRTSGGSADLSDGEAQIKSLAGYASIVGEHTLVGIATPTSLKSTLTNQFNPVNVLTGYEINGSTGKIEAKAGSYVAYIHAVGNICSGAENDALVGYTVYDENSSIGVVGFYSNIPTTASTVLLNGAEDYPGHTLYIGRDNYTSGGKDWSSFATSMLTNVQNYIDGYICVSTTDISKLCVHPRWSGYKNDTYEAFGEDTITIPTLSAIGESLPTSDWGFPSIGSTRDEINYIDYIYTQRIGHYPFSQENLATVMAITSNYAYNANDIIYVLPSAIVYNLAETVKNTYNVADFGTEEFLGTSLPVESVNLYLQNLRDKLRRDVITYGDVVDNLISTSATAPLSANMGRVLNDEKADKDGTYAGMHVGLADNLFSTDNTSSIGTYYFRTAGGDASLENGAAYLTSVQGNASVPEYTTPKASAAVTTTPTAITASVDAAVFAASPIAPETGSYTFIYNGTAWTYNSTVIADITLTYGITVTGTAVNGDNIVVTFTKGTTTITQVVGTSELVLAIDRATYESRGSQGGATIPSSKSFMYNSSASAWRVAINYEGTWTETAAADTPAEWGASITSGTPANGDVFTIAYTSHSASASTAKTKFSAAVDIATFEDVKISNVYLTSGTYKFAYVGATTSWSFFKQNGENWDTLATGITTQALETSYGVSISGAAPVDTDYITIVFSAASISGAVKLAHPDYFEASSMQWYNSANKQTGYIINASGVPEVTTGKSIQWFRIEGGLSNGYIIRNTNANTINTARVGWSTIAPVSGSTVTSTACTLFTYSATFGSDELIGNNAGKIVPSSNASAAANTTYVVFPPAEAKYIWVSAESTDATTLGALFAHPRWSKSDFDIYNIGDNPWAPSRIYLDTVTVDGASHTGFAFKYYDDGWTAHNLPWKDFGGLPAVNRVRDEINLDSMIYSANVGKQAFANGDTDHAVRRQLFAYLDALKELNVDYVYDLTTVYYVRPAVRTAVLGGTYYLEAKTTYTIPKVYQHKTNYNLIDAKAYNQASAAEKANYEEYQLSSFTVNDYGYESFPASFSDEVGAMATTLYGTNLKDKLRRDVVTGADLSQGGTYYNQIVSVAQTAASESTKGAKRNVITSGGTIGTSSAGVAPNTSYVMTGAPSAITLYIDKAQLKNTEEQEWRVTWQAGSTVSSPTATNPVNIVGVGSGTGITVCWGDACDEFVETESGHWYELSVCNLGALGGGNYILSAAWKSVYTS